MARFFWIRFTEVRLGGMLFSITKSISIVFLDAADLFNELDHKSAI